MRLRARASPKKPSNKPDELSRAGTPPPYDAPTASMTIEPPGVWSCPRKGTLAGQDSSELQNRSRRRALEGTCNRSAPESRADLVARRVPATKAGHQVARRYPPPDAPDHRMDIASVGFGVFRWAGCGGGVRCDRFVCGGLD